ncbi:ATP-dependent DNA helicase RecQ [Bifidobacterium tissieri]|uniref:ATP-dependent DNA helicase RecQ n=1 Tax=Bifidobacterium tissieri TaxID=1630162 RepID=A0A261FDS9_9BIFI|nr:RecQ family ATP-dependent DNA helicase [Bifidobacterium tissieri]OZG57301.1 ATP-dependent DNA helicase RecQ [Bifidobacterium tissieri]
MSGPQSSSTPVTPTSATAATLAVSSAQSASTPATSSTSAVSANSATSSAQPHEQPSHRQQPSADRDLTPFALKALERYFGYTSFRTGQADVVNAIMNHHDVLAVLPTGAGKSVCYQLPAAALRLTLVITPLRALMRDQVQALARRGIAAALIDSGTANADRRRIYEDALAGRLKLLYVAPERLHTNDFLSFATHAPIDLIAVDEAHCVLQWGQDFRPAYLGIRSFVQQLTAHMPRPVIAAFTATATPSTRKEIIANLGQISPARVTTTFDRPNIRFDIRAVKRWNRERVIVDWARMYKGQCGIVYCGSRDRTEELEQALLDAGIAAAHFHARMPEEDKGPVQDRFLRGEIQVICATSAFGMGVDKPDVRWVINDGATDSLEEYYQEAGRAGRDGKQSVSLLLWSSDDFEWLHKRVAKSYANAAMDDEESKRAKAAAIARLDAMQRYCETPGCLRAELLRYFGETAESASGATGGGKAGAGNGKADKQQGKTKAAHCGSCSHCLGLYTMEDLLEDDDRSGSGGYGGRGGRGGGDGRWKRSGGGGGRGRDFDGTRYEDLDVDYDASCSDGWGSSDDSQDSRNRYGHGRKSRGGRRYGKSGVSYSRYGSRSGSSRSSRDDDDFDASQTSGKSGKALRTSTDSVYSAMFGSDSD